MFSELFILKMLTSHENYKIESFFFETFGTGQ